MRDGWMVAALLSFAAMLSLVGACAMWRARYLDADERLKRMNPYARLLGSVVEVRELKRDVWVRAVVVAVGWHGSVCVRPTNLLEEPGWWVRRENAAWRIREVAK